MKFTIAPTLLAQILEFANRYIAKNATLPILQNVYLQTKDDTLEVIATDMEKFIHLSQPVDVQAPGAITVDAQTLYKIAKTIPDSLLQLTTDDEKDTLHIQSSNDKFELKGMPANDYVASPEVHAKTSATISTQSFVTAVEKIIGSVTEKSFSPVFTGVFFHLNAVDNKLICAGTDSFILSEYQVKLEKKIPEEQRIIIPKKAAIDLLHIAQSCCEEDKDSEMKINFGTNMLGVEIPYKNMNIYTTTILIQGTFPNYHNEKIMPTSFNTTVELQANALQKEVNKIGILATDMKNLILIDIQENIMKVSNGRDDKGKGETTFEITTQGENVKFFVNGSYLNEIISHLNGKELHINIVNDRTPLLFTDPSDEHYKVIVRPLQP